MQSWDRQPFVTTVATGKPSLVPLPNQFKHMFLVANYGANGGCMDNDVSSRGGVGLACAWLL